MTTDTPPPPSEAETVLSVLEAAVRLGAATEESQRINIGLRLATLAPAILRMIRRQPEAASAAAVPEGVKTFVGYSMRNNCKFFKVYPFDTWEAANAAAAAYLAAPPPPVDAVGEDVEQRVRDLVDFWFSPWGAAKGARWEEISGDKEFSAENMLRLIRDALQARPTPSGDAVDSWRDIATAPKDGSKFLAYEDSAYYATAWSSDYECWLSLCGQPVVSSPEPTHWRPLPLPPIQPAQEGGA